MTERRKPGTIECILNFLDRRPRGTIGFWEQGTSGFGDRMRGIAYLLFLAKKHGAKTILYKDARPTGSLLPSKAAFPARLTNLIALEGLEFAESPNDFPDDAQIYFHYCNLGNPLKRYGFSEMWRVKPKDEEIRGRLAEIAAAGPYLGFHSRATDSFFAQGELQFRKGAALKTLRQHADQMGVRRVYLASDNQTSWVEWQQNLASSGFDVIESGVTFNDHLHRQTSNFDMMKDFFALAGASRIVRIIPSEFSRFAAWVGQRRLRYYDLS